MEIPHVIKTERKWGMKIKTILVWSPSCPGLKVIVKRNLFQQLFYPMYFATLGEQIYDRNEI